MAVAQFNKPISRFRCDRGEEYLTRDVISYFEQKGIQFECTIGDTQAQNGVAERRNRTVAEKARCMIIESGIRKDLWNEAVLAAVCYRQISTECS